MYRVSSCTKPCIYFPRSHTYRGRRALVTSIAKLILYTQQISLLLLNNPVLVHVQISPGTGAAHLFLKKSSTSTASYITRDSIATNCAAQAPLFRWPNGLSCRTAPLA